MSERQTDITIAKMSTLLAERRFYDDTFLYDDDHASLFVCDAAVVRGPSGRERVRSVHTVLQFDTVDDLVAAVVEGGWERAPLDGNPRWMPTREQVEL